MRAALCIALFTSLIAAQTPAPEQLFRSAVNAQQRGDYPAAIREYRRLLKIQPNSPGVLANLGAALVHEKRFDEGIADYRAALKLVPGNAAIQMNLALAFYKKGDVPSAAQDFAALWKLKPGDPRLATLLGDCYVKLGRARDAVVLLQPAAAANPGDLDLDYVLGLALIDTAQRREGVAFIQRVAQQRHSPDAYLLAGSTWLDLNEPQKAKTDLETALQMNPDLPGIHTLLGLARDHLGDPAGAQPEFRQALAKNPNDFQANLILGAELYKERRLAEARKYLQRAAVLQPSSPVAKYELALVERADGELDAAAADLERVTKQDPHWLEPHVELAALYYKLHRPADGAKERQIVDRLTAEQQKQGPR
jgi:tetratricopeptide (TPR) repeat protein